MPPRHPPIKCFAPFGVILTRSDIDATRGRVRKVLALELNRGDRRVEEGLGGTEQLRDGYVGLKQWGEEGERTGEDKKDEADKRMQQRGVPEGNRGHR